MNTWSNLILDKSLRINIRCFPLFSHRILLWAIVISGFLLPISNHALSVNAPFPNLASFNLEGTLPDLKGKVVLLDFFASWCAPCKASFPVMQELHKEFGSKGLVVVAVNLDDKKEEMQRFLKKHPSDFIIVRDATKKLVSTINIATLPSSFILDREGRVHSIHNGFKGNETKRKYTEEITALLK